MDWDFSYNDPKVEEVVRNQVVGRGGTFSPGDIEDLLIMLLAFFDHFNAGEQNTGDYQDLIGELHAHIYRMGITGIDEIAEKAVERRGL